jgi:hypothetical protein
MKPPHVAQTGAQRSGCLSLRGFSAVYKYPDRSPLLVADFIGHEAQARGGGVCEIGTRHGDLTRCIKHFGYNITAIEMVEPYCKALRAEGVSVLCQPIESISSEWLEAAQCRTYFWWAMNAATQNEKWLRHLVHEQTARGSNASVFIVHEDSESDLSPLRMIYSIYGGVRIHRILFDEADDQPWDANCSVTSNAGSYATACWGRRGPWGVFHLAQFDIGPGTVTEALTASVAKAEWKSRYDKARRTSYGKVWH